MKTFTIMSEQFNVRGNCGGDKMSASGQTRREEVITC